MVTTLVRSSADKVGKAIAIMRGQLRDLNARLSILEQTTSEARQSFAQGNPSGGICVSTESDILSRQAEAIRLRASIESAQSALSTLLGLPFGPR